MTFPVWDCHRRTRTGGLVATVLSFSIAPGLEKPLEPQLRGPVILALLVRYAHVSIPVVSAHVFETLLMGYLVLLVGNLFRGL